MATHFVAIHTKTPVLNDNRNVTLSYNTETGQTFLLGNLLHNTEIEVNQQLVDDLQFLVDQKKENKK
jgi:hypothetical protein